MSKEQDLLFCKIAISSGMLSQEMAQKALALANRFEAEGKRRPQVGAIFIKQNLLKTEDVQKIYGAVQKRLQAQGGARSAAATAVRQGPARGAPPRAAGAQPAVKRRGQLKQAPAPVGRAVRASHKPATEKLDPITLWSGIGFAVVILGCIGAMLFMLLSGNGEVPEVQGGLLPSPEAKTPAASSAPVQEVTPARAAGNREALRKMLSPETAGEKTPSPSPGETPPGTTEEPTGETTEEPAPSPDTMGPGEEDFGAGVE